jgi:hypothetical protein
MRRGSAEVSPPTPTRRLCPLEPHQGQSPLDPFILAGEWERVDTAVDRSRPALSHSPANGEIAKGRAWHFAAPVLSRDAGAGGAVS